MPASRRVVYFADLSHITPGKEWTIIPLPLNVGFMAAFLEKMLPGAFEIRIFKQPHKLLEALKNQRPDMVAFSNYIWNKNLQLGFARHVKSLYPDCVTAMGGPNYNFEEPEWLERFARKNPQIDFHIEGEGEVKLYNLAAACLEHGFSPDAVKRARPAGMAYIDPGTDRLQMLPLRQDDKSWSRLDGLDIDPANGRLRDLDDIPSPYLTGVLDDFLLDPIFCPIIETNRGCPYSCTFCNWGAMGKSKSAMFSIERVVAELKYIAAKNVSRTPYLYVGDANFGIFQRDVDIANLLRELKDKAGFPQNVYMYFAKNSSEKVIRIAEILKDMTPISLSRQTQNDEVLKNIKRGNISMETFNSLAGLAKSLGIDSKVELIYTLPGESKESFYAGVRDVVKQNVDGLHMFPAMLLDGSEMGTKASRDKYGIVGEWRRIDGCAGTYGPVRAIEFEEIITSTAAMSRDDHMEVRVFHLLQSLFLDTKLYKDVEVLIGGDRTLFDVCQDVIQRLDRAPAPVRTLLHGYIEAAKKEFLQACPEEFTDEDIARSRGGRRKLIPLFMAKLLHDPGVRPAFNAYLKDIIRSYGTATDAEIDGVLSFIDAMIYPFDGSVNIDVALKFDAVAFARREPFKKHKAADFLSAEPRVFRYHKPFTYHEFVEKMDAALTTAEKVYEVVVHHTHEKLRYTLIRRLQGELEGAGQEKREIRLEGGWLY